MRPFGFRLAVAVALATAAVALTAPGAGAHALLVGSSPLDSEVVETSPDEIVLRFAEPIESEFSSASLADDRGRPVPGSRSSVGADGSSLVVGVRKDLRPGVYSVSWRILSDDAHPVEGVLVFGVGAETVVAAAGGQEAPLKPEEALVKWLIYLALAGILGGLAAGCFVFPRVGDSRRALRAALWSTYAALALGCVQIGMQVASLGPGSGEPTSALLSRLLGETRWGTAWLGRQLLLAFLAATTYLLLGRLTKRPFGAAVLLAGLACVALAFTLTLAGHSAGLTRDFELAVTMDALHLLSACLWVGIVAVTALVLLRSPPEARRASFRPIARLAAPAAVIAVATGFYSAGRQIVTIDALEATLYGNALLAKVGVVLAMSLLGASNAVLVRPGLARPLGRALGRPPGWTPIGRERLSALVAAEACLGAAVLLAAGILASAPPGSSALAAAKPALPPTVLSKTSGDVFVSLAVKPNRPGDNLFLLRAASTRRPVQAPVTAVSLSFREPGDASGVRVPMTPVGEGRFQLGSGFLEREGSWEITTVLEREGFAPTLVRFDWTIGPVPVAAPDVRRGPLESVLTLVAVSLLAGLVAACAWFAFGTSALAPRPSSRKPDPIEEPLRP